MPLIINRQFPAIFQVNILRPVLIKIASELRFLIEDVHHIESHVIAGRKELMYRFRVISFKCLWYICQGWRACRQANLSNAWKIMHWFSQCMEIWKKKFHNSIIYISLNHIEKNAKLSPTWIFLNDHTLQLFSKLFVAEFVFEMWSV